MQVWLPYVILAAAIAAIIFIAYFIIRYYIEKDQAYFITLLSCSVAFVAVLLALAIIPLDVYSVSSSLYPDGTPRYPTQSQHIQTLVKWSYSIVYLVIILTLVLVLPYMYCYYDSETDHADSRSQRFASALRGAVIFLIAFAVCLGFVFILYTFSNHSESSEVDWQKRIFDGVSHWETFLTLCISILSVAGLFFYIPYIAYGIAVLPVFIIKGRSNPVTEMRQRLLDEEQELLTQQRSVEHESAARQLDTTSRGNTSTLDRMAQKYGYRERNPNRSDQLIRHDPHLRKIERQLTSNKQRQDALETKSAFWTKLWAFLGPFRYVLGAIFLLCSGVLVAQQIINIVDRIIHSSCGIHCGFTKDMAGTIINPLDYVLYRTSDYFPADLIIYGIILAYLFICLFYATSELGIRFLFWKVHELTPSATPSNAIVLFIFIFSLSALCINQQMVQSMPQYSSFGSQFFINTTTPNITFDNNNIPTPSPLSLSDPLAILHSTITTTTTTITQSIPQVDLTSLSQQFLAAANTTQTRCTLEVADLNNTCRLTQFGKFLQKVNNMLPFFSILHLLATFVFVVFVGLCFLYALFKRPEVEQLWQSDDPSAPNYMAD